jgi:YegS/Rv2252/BmrU family lipid kinase
MLLLRLLLCANPASGGETVPGQIAAKLQSLGAEVELRGIDELGDPDGGDAASSPAAQAARDADRLVVAGGDGSLGLAAAAAAAAGVPLAVIPTGTANDFARSMGLPRDLQAACALAADPGATVRPLELARAGRRPFVNAASAGLAPVAARAAHPLKKRLGPLAYAVGALRAGVTAHPLALRVVVDGAEAFAGGSWQVVIGSTGAFGGGSQIGGTDVADGRLDVAIVPAEPRVALVRRALAMRLGRLAAQSGVRHVLGREVTVHAPPGTPFNVDGELCHCGEPALFTVEPRAFRVVMPR